MAHEKDREEKCERREHREPRVITLSDIAACLWVRKLTVITFTLIGAACGIYYAIQLPDVYTAQMSMVPESNEGTNKANATLAALGMAAPVATEDAYAPTIYPDIVSSIPFIMELLDVEVQTSSSDSTFTLRQYVETHTKPGPIGKLLGNSETEEADKSARELIDPFKLTKSETALYNDIKGQVHVLINNKTRAVEVSVTMQDPLVAAQLTDTVAARLQEYITDYRTAKARQDLDYAISINEEAKEQYYDAQTRYAEWMDRNQALATYEAQSERDRLENDMQLAFNLFNQTSQKLQAAEAKVQDVTPVFAVVDPATVPVTPSGPKKKLIALMWTLAFFVLGSLISCRSLIFTSRFKRKVEREAALQRKARRKLREKMLRHRKGKGEKREEREETPAVEEIIIEDTHSDSPYIPEEEIARCLQEGNPPTDIDREDDSRFRPRDEQK